MIDVLVADDQTLIRSAVGDLIAHEPDLRLAGAAENGIEAVRMATDLHPDVVVMDIRMPLLDGIEATRMITGNPDLSTVRVLILTTFEDDPDYVVRGVQSGASGFVGKGAEPDVLTDAIRTVHRGEGLLSPVRPATCSTSTRGRTSRPGCTPSCRCSPSGRSTCCDWWPRGGRTRRSHNSSGSPWSR